MSGTWGNVVRNVGARKQIINAELVAMMELDAREEQLLAWAEKGTEEKGRREDKITPRSAIKTQTIHRPHVLACVSSDERC